MRILMLSIFEVNLKTNTIKFLNEKCLNDIPDAKEIFDDHLSLDVCYDEVEPLDNVKIIDFVHKHFENKETGKTKTGYFILPGFSESACEYYAEWFKKKAFTAGKFDVISKSIDFLKLNNDEKENVLSYLQYEENDEAQNLNELKVLEKVEGMLEFFKDGLKKDQAIVGFVYDATNAVSL